jgi:hypothetical protein
MKRQHGTGRLYVKWGSYYGRWRTPDGRYVNRRIGKVRSRGEAEGLNRREAERALRRLVEIESVRRPPTIAEQPRWVDDVVEALRERLARRARGKLVLCGDHRQLPSIRAGGAFRAVAARTDAIELTNNRRQQEAWDRLYVVDASRRTE